MKSLRLPIEKFYTQTLWSVWNAPSKVSKYTRPAPLERRYWLRQRRLEFQSLTWTRTSWNTSLRRSRSSPPLYKTSHFHRHKRLEYLPSVPSFDLSNRQKADSPWRTRVYADRRRRANRFLRRSLRRCWSTTWEVGNSVGSWEYPPSPEGFEIRQSITQS